MEEARAGGELASQLRRERLLDMERRLARVRRKAFVVLALALAFCGPWVSFWFLIPLGLAIGGFVVADRRMATSLHPERWAAAGWALAPAVIAASIALTGAATSPAKSWLALPAVTLGARFERRGVLAGVVYILVLLILVTVVLDWPGVAERPDRFVFPFALVLAVTILASAVGDSDREHRHGAVVDPLTGLLNRAALAQRIAELEHQAKRRADAGPVGVIVADVDHFKRVNDEHGHARGDAVLREIAYAMREALRAFDVVFRLGGEEFVVLLPDADLAAAQEIAERLRAAVSEAVPVTMSFGVAVAEGRQFDLDAVLASADAALYAAKRGGRDRVCLADAPPALLPA